MRHPRLLKRQGWFYLRAKVPVDLVAVLGRREIKKALGTADPKRALEKVRQESARVDRLFAEARRQAATQRLKKSTATEAEVTAMVRRWWRDHQNEPPDYTDTDTGLSEALHVLEIDEGMLLDRDDPGTAAAVHKIAVEIEHRHGLRLDPGSREHVLTRELIRRGLLESVRRIRQHAKGEPERPRDVLFSGPVDDPPSKGSVTLGELITAYERDPARGGLTTKTVNSYAPVFRALRELLGADTPVRSITRDDCRRVRDVLVALPPNATKLFPRLPLEKIAHRAKAEGLPSLNAVTINNHLNNLSALFRWAIKEEHLDRNPAMGLRVAEPVAKRDRRRPFTLAELQAIFAGPLYAPHAERSGDAWVLMLSLFAGLRLNEGCQLATKDVEIVDTVPVIRVRLGDEGKTRLKSTAATRMVPIHSALVKAGLLDHWRKMIKRGERQLFADLRPAATGYYSDAASKRLNRYIRGLGISDRRAAVHSLRHNWRDALREAGVSAERVRALGGWTSKSAGEEEHTYGAGFTAKSLAVEIERITYPGLDLSP